MILAPYFFISLEASPAPVSDTHLDVYKRQAQGAQNGPAPDAGSASSSSNGDNVVDADYKEV